MLYKSLAPQEEFALVMEVRDGKKGEENSSRQEISVDEIYGDLGELGLWQWGCLMGLWLPSAAAGFVILSFSFVGKNMVEMGGWGTPIASEAKY